MKVCICSSKQLFLKFCKFHRKVTLLESLFHKVAGLQAYYYYLFCFRFTTIQLPGLYPKPEVTGRDIFYMLLLLLLFFVVVVVVIEGFGFILR